MEKIAEAEFNKDELIRSNDLLMPKKAIFSMCLNMFLMQLSLLHAKNGLPWPKTGYFSVSKTNKRNFWNLFYRSYRNRVEELDQEKLPDLLTLKYHALSDATQMLGGTDKIRQTFIAFQKFV